MSQFFHSKKLLKICALAICVVLISSLIMSGCTIATQTVTATTSVTVMQTVAQIPTTPISSSTSVPTNTNVSALIIGVDIHHSSEGGDTFTNLASAKGWQIIKLDIEPLTYNVLKEKGIRVLYICGGVALPYTDQELKEIQSFVSNGGILVISNDYGYRQSTRELTQLFYIDIVQTMANSYGLTMSVNSTDPLLNGVHAIYLDYYTSALQVQSPATVLLSGGSTQPYEPFIAEYQNQNGGKVLVYPDTVEYQYADNGMFLNNILKCSQ
ncbi:MAG: hypothetical protein ABSD79_03970 [Dehalococcoidales bacterium]|jgi:hypothetical protein